MHLHIRQISCIGFKKWIFHEHYFIFPFHNETQVSKSIVVGLDGSLNNPKSLSSKLPTFADIENEVLPLVIADSKSLILHKSVIIPTDLDSFKIYSQTSS